MEFTVVSSHEQTPGVNHFGFELGPSFCGKGSSQNLLWVIHTTGH